MPDRMWGSRSSLRGQVSVLVEEQVRQRILQHAAKIVPEKAAQIIVRFRGPFCYIDAHDPGSQDPMHLCRLRYHSRLRAWSLAFYTYSHEKYEPCVFGSGATYGTPEEALEIGALYLP